MRSARATWQSNRSSSYVCPISVLSTIYELSVEELSFLDAAKYNDLETVHQFLTKQKHRFKSLEEDCRIFSISDAALILAIHKQNRDVIKLLVSKGLILREPHSKSCQCRECSCLGVLLNALSRLNTYKAMSDPTYLSLCYLYANPLESTSVEPGSKDSSHQESSVVEVDAFRSKLDPICRAFELNGKLEKLAVIQYEFMKEYRALSNQCEVYAVELLNLCQNMNEIACVMSMPGVHRRGQDSVDTGATDLSVLNFAIKNKNERFVAHPYSQLMLNSVLYRGLRGWQYRSLLTRTCVIFIFTILLPFWSLFYIVAPQNSLNDILKAPLAKFMSNVISFIWFLGLLTLATFDDTLGQMMEVSIVNILISFWVIGMIFKEIREYFRLGGQQYLSHWWNIVTILMLVLFLLAGLLWMIGHTSYHISKDTPHHSHFVLFRDVFKVSKEWAFKCLLLSSTLYSVAFLLSFLHISNTLQVNSYIGPLHLSLVQMCGDVAKFLMLFCLFYFAFVLALRKLYSQYVMISSFSSSQFNTTSPAQHSFTDVFSGFGYLYWALFDKTDLDVFKINSPEFKITETTGEIMFGIYNIMAILIALNMLIAMMANSFQKVADDADIQWKFSRTRMWMQYVEKGSDVPPPFNLIPNWKTILSALRWLLKGKKKDKYEEISSESAADRENNRKTIILNLISRYFTETAVTNHLEQREHFGMT